MVSKAVTPANARVQSHRGGMISLDCRVRGNEENREVLTSNEVTQEGLPEHNFVSHRMPLASIT